MSGTVKALVNLEKPVIRICAYDDRSTPEEYAEIQFETQADATAAVEQFNEILKKATGVVFKKT
jgi:hypothetical protein